LQTAPIRRWCHQQRRKSPFFIVATLWPCLNNGLHECDVVRNDSLSNDNSAQGGVHPSSPGPTPQPPRGGTSLWLPLATTPPKKMGVKMHRTPSCVHLKWKYNIRLPPKKRPSRAKATRLQVVNMLGWIWKSAIACFKAWSNQRATYYIYSGSWFVARFYCLRFHLLLWCLICTF